MDYGSIQRKRGRLEVVDLARGLALHNLFVVSESGIPVFILYGRGPCVLKYIYFKLSFTLVCFFVGRLDVGTVEDNQKHQL